jgi:hypothetical protein
VAENYSTPTEETTRSTPARGHSFDPLALVAGVAALLVSAYILTDGTLPLPDIPGRWLLAGAAAFIALLMLLGSLRKRR